MYLTLLPSSLNSLHRLNHTKDYGIYVTYQLRGYKRCRAKEGLSLALLGKG